MKKSNLSLSKVVSKKDELALYDLFEMSFGISGIDENGKLVISENVNEECEFLKSIKENPLNFFKLPKAAFCLKITKENPYFFDKAFKVFKQSLATGCGRWSLERENETKDEVLKRVKKLYLKSAIKVAKILNNQTENLTNN